MTEPTAEPKRHILNIIVRIKKKFCLCLCQSSFVHVRQRDYGYERRGLTWEKSGLEPAAPNGLAGIGSTALFI